MPNPLLSIIGDTVGNIVNPIGKVIDSLHTSQDEKNKARNELQRIADETYRAQMAHAEAIAASQRDVIVAELKQDDKYTKRARPSLVYVGLGAMVVNHIVLPWTAWFTGATTLPHIDLPAEFWIGWSGVVGAWAIGRSVEKKARIENETPGKVTRMITGK